jgi:hypothetical protein
MNFDKRLLPGLLARFALILALSIVAVWLVSEVGILFQQDENTARSPATIILTIPAGTAAKVARGESEPQIPEEMTFVLGDVLVVRNLDDVAHTLGPLLVPPGASASMPLNRADHFALNCDFNSSSYFGLNVKPPTTRTTRIRGIIFAAPPTAAMVFIYSLIVFPVKPKETEPARNRATG